MSALAITASLPAIAAALVLIGARGTERLCSRVTLAAATLAIAGVVASAFGAQIAIDQNDRLSIVLLAVVLSISAVVLSFAERYMADEPNRRIFQANAALLTSAAAWIAVAPNVATFAVAWLLCGVALFSTVRSSREGGATRPAAQMARTAELTGSGAMLAATALTLVVAGNAALTEIGAAASELSASELALGFSALDLTALLLVVATAARCAQLPLGGWLQASLTAPTPVSALMHAGVVNAGGVLIVRWGPLVTESTVAMSLLFAVAVTTLIATTTAMMARPDVKGSLALSTRAQMAFMLIQCSMGAFGAAMFHLVAHGMYKASKFLGSGEAVVASKIAHRDLPSHAADEGGALRRAVIAAGTATVSVVGAALTIEPEIFSQPGDLTLMAFAWATAAQALWWWQSIRRPALGGTLAAIAAVTTASFAYFAGYSLFAGFLAPALPVAASGVVSGWAVVPVFVAAVAVTFARWTAESGGLHEPSAKSVAGRIYRSAYARAIAVGQSSHQFASRGLGSRGSVPSIHSNPKEALNES